jgi:hypothetical protein
VTPRPIGTPRVDPIDFTGVAMTDDPGTLIEVGNTITSTLDGVRRPQEIFRLLLGTGDRLRVTLECAKECFARIAYPQNAPELRVTGQMQFTPPGGEFAWTVQGIYRIDVSTTERDVRYTLRIAPAPPEPPSNPATNLDN